MQMIETVPLQTDVFSFVDELLTGFVDIIPGLVGAVIILVIGWIIGRVVGGVVRRVVDGVEIDRMVLKTPIGEMLGGTEKAVSGALGKVAAYFIYALAILAAADALAIELLSAWIADAVSYLPSLIAGALIIVVGFVVADWLADAIGRTETVTDSGYTEVFADGFRFFLYFVILVMGLGTMGVDVGILNTFASALAIGLAAGVALAIGLSFGLGGRDYVGENIAGWLGRAGSEVEIEPTTVESGGPGSPDPDVSPQDD